MTDAQKKNIQGLLIDHIANYPSQAKAVAALKEISESYVISIRRGEWEGISDAMWTSLGKQLGYNNKVKWHMVETRGTRILKDLFDDAREYGNVFAVSAPAGSGKSFYSETYAKTRDNVYVITCAEYFNRKVFLEQVLEAMGKGSQGLSVHEMMELIVTTMYKKDKALLILDEVDKLTDSVLYFFITLYNRLAGNSGIVIMATEHLSKRIMRGKRMNRKGYSEIYSRIGRRFIAVPDVTDKEVAEICKANGLDDPAAITTIYNECEGDLRRVKRGVHRASIKTLKKAA